jgi:uncharacterized protein (DUF1778 family)
MRGRPKSSKDELKSNSLRIRLTPKDREKLDQAASAESAETSTWARQMLLALADQVLASAHARRKK